MSEQFDVILGGLDTEVDVTMADSTGVDPSVLLALRGEKGDKGDTGAAGQDGTDGVDGVDGVSPIATVSKVGDTATITITDANGTTTANISDGTDGVDGTDGTDGQDGFSPIATVTKAGVTATITITDKYGTTTAEIHDGGASAFVAEFNVTTYADVKDAYDNDAILICTVPDGDNTMTLQLVYFDDANEIFFFAFPTSEGWYLTHLSNADGWGDEQFYFASTDVATQLADGLMSALDKQKLDGIASGAEVNVQSDWNQSVNTADDYIKNKPTIPTVPTNVSAFNNDAGYLASESDPIFTASDAYGIDSTDISNWNGKQDALVSGTNIKTINNTSLLGSGDITVAAGGTSVPTANEVAEFDSSAHINSADMSSQDVSDFVDGLDANKQEAPNDLGSFVNLASYTSSNMYTCTSDGYVFVYGGSNTAYAAICGSTNDTNIIALGVGSGRDSVYVRKGMRAYTVGSPSAVRFFPLV